MRWVLVSALDSIPVIGCSIATTQSQWCPPGSLLFPSAQWCMDGAAALHGLSLGPELLSAEAAVCNRENLQLGYL